MNDPNYDTVKCEICNRQFNIHKLQCEFTSVKNISDVCIRCIFENTLFGYNKDQVEAEFMMAADDGRGVF